LKMCAQNAAFIDSPAFIDFDRNRQFLETFSLLFR
jgi:hypothetical protein